MFHLEIVKITTEAYSISCRIEVVQLMPKMSFNYFYQTCGMVPQSLSQEVCSENKILLKKNIKAKSANLKLYGCLRLYEERNENKGDY